MSNQNFQKPGKGNGQQQGSWTWVPQDEELEHDLESRFIHGIVTGIGDAEAPTRPLLISKLT